MTGPKNALAEKLAEKAREVLDVTSAPDFPPGEGPGVPASDPVPDGAEQSATMEQEEEKPKGFSAADLFDYNYLTISPAVIGEPNSSHYISNATERGLMRQKLVDTALELTKITLFGRKTMEKSDG